jgi:hypothetical protein
MWIAALPLAWLAADCAVGQADACGPDRFCEAVFDPDTAACPAAGTCRPLPPVPADLELPLPVPAGARVFCTQGVLGAGAATHSTCSEDRRFALDLASSAFEAPLVVLAAADGVAHGWGGCASTDLNHDPPDARCNLGLGNVVRIGHRDGLFTQYAHLSAIFVVPGQIVKRGDPIGVEGNSGAAGSHHIHFSLHRGDAAQLRPAPSLPIRRLRARGAGGGRARIIDSLRMRCNEADADGGPSPAIAYVSDNVARPRPAQIGFEPPERLLLERAVGQIFDPATRARGIALLRAGVSDEPLARYWLAVGLELDGTRAEARQLFRALARSEVGPSWVRRWSWVRLADMDAADGRAADARRELDEGTTDAPPSDVDFLRFADQIRREIDWLDRHPR